MKWLPADCEYGDMVRVKLGSIYHYGIFASEDEVIAFGLPPVERFKDDPMKLTVCAIDADTFSCGNIIEKAVFDRKELKKKNPPDAVVSLARGRIGETGYNLIHNNCEHFVNECVFGVSRSTQEEEARARWLSRPICDVYLMKIPDDAEFSELKPEERDREVSNCRAPALKKAMYTDWKLLEFAAMRSLGIDISKEEIRKNRHGRWNCPSFDFSLSHTDTEVAVAVSNGAVGVDIESEESFGSKKEGTAKKIADRFFTKKERIKYADGTETFLTCWTRKEAQFKRGAKGSFRPSSIETSDTDTETYVTEDGDKTVLSVSADNISKIRIFRTDIGSTSIAKLKRID